jgi:predicted dehydrogenase
MSDQEKVGLGILGAANIARKNIRAIKLLDIIRVVAIGSRDITKAQALITEWELDDTAVAYDSYEKVLQDPRVDAVYIPLPSTLHVEWVTKAAAAGKHILLEKPIAVTTEDSDLILKACTSNQVQLMDGTMWMHHNRTKEMESVLKSGKLGPIKEVVSSFSFAAPPDFIENDIRFKKSGDPLGCLGDLGWYSIRAILWSFGKYEMPESVVAHHGAVFNQEGVPTAMSGSLLFSGGRRGIFTCSFDCALTQRLQITGTDGTIVVDDYVIPKNDKKVDFVVSQNHSLGKYDLADVTEREIVVVENFLPQEALMWETFAKCVQNIKRNGQEQINHEWSTLAEKTQKIVSAIMKSATRGYIPISNF